MTDALSEVLRAVRLAGAVFFKVEASAPWVAETPRGETVAPHLMPGVDHVIGYHIVTSGSCFGGVAGEPAVRLDAGDIIVFPQGDAHVMSSEPNRRGLPDIDVYRCARESRLPVAITMQGGGDGGAHVVCGFLGCDVRPFNPLLATLPRVMLLRGGGARDSVMHQLVELAVLESNQPRSGSASVLSRASELLFVEVVRRYMDTLAPETRDWFAGLRDEVVGRALEQLHRRPAHAWSLEELAKEVRVSRSVLAERFAHYVGTPPMQYFAKWRIQLAASLLRTSSMSLAEIADHVGYGSEAALSRAFKRLVGTAPAHYRRVDEPASAQPA